MKTTDAIFLFAVVMPLCAIAQTQETSKLSYPSYFQPVDVSAAADPLMGIVRETKDPDAKWRAIRALGVLRYEGAVPLMMECLKDEHHYVRANSARALGDMKVKAESVPLLNLLDSETDGGVIEQASLALRYLGVRAAVPLLKKHADHPSLQTRGWVLQAIGDLGTRDDIPFLAERLNAKDVTEREFAAQAVGALAGVDFGFPKEDGPHNPEPAIERARTWWNENKGDIARSEKRQAQPTSPGDGAIRAAPEK